MLSNPDLSLTHNTVLPNPNLTLGPITHNTQEADRVMFNLSAGLFFPPKLASLHVRTLSALQLYAAPPDAPLWPSKWAHFTVLSRTPP